MDIDDIACGVVALNGQGMNDMCLRAIQAWRSVFLLITSALEVAPNTSQYSSVSGYPGEM